MADRSVEPLATASDIKWIDLLPIHAQPYAALARVDRPTGIWLLWLPCAWSTAFFARDTASLWLLVLFGAGAVVARAAGCVINDLADRKYDAMVDRTRTRPLASGRLSVKQAVAFLIALLIVAAAVLLLLPATAIMMSLLAAPLVALYPFVKRFTHWPQVVLGAVYNWGVLVGCAATHTEVPSGCIVLYLAAIAWTVGYDTIYALQDRESDCQIGIKSTAVLFGNASVWCIAGFYVVAFVGFMATGILLHAGCLWFVSVFLAGGMLTWQAWTLDLSDMLSCRRRFNASRDVGLVLLGGALCQRFF
jgi:4-hydroxybenzoate polyprenyltransferase